MAELQKQLQEERKQMSERASQRIGDLNPFYGKEHSEETIDETFENLVDDSLESEQAELSEEVLELIQLSEFVDPPVNIFKPNYWNKRKYYWGNTPLGQNGKNNYWYYG